MCEEAMMFGMNYQDIVTSRDKDILVGCLWPGILSGEVRQSPYSRSLQVVFFCCNINKVA